MDITTVFGTVVGGSNPSEGTKKIEKIAAIGYTPPTVFVARFRIFAF
jgi:hypothetical protein